MSPSEFLELCQKDAPLCSECGHEGEKHEPDGRCAHVFGIEGTETHWCGCEASVPAGDGTLSPDSLTTAALVGGGVLAAMMVGRWR